MSVWISDGGDLKAYVEDDAVDFWRVRGWRVADEPQPGERVWLQHDVHEGRQLFNAAVVPVWGQLGWLPCAPPDPVDLLKDPVTADAAGPVLIESQPDAPKAVGKSSKSTAVSEKE